MPLQAPNLDTRSYDQLVQSARLRIPQYTPDWTDFNESDPGITLIELFAWLTEMMLYQMNQVPDRNYIKFLQLLGMELQPAQPAEAHLTFTTQAGADVSPITAGAQIAAQPPAGGNQLIFETENGLDLIRLPLSALQVYDGTSFTEVTQENQATGKGFRPFGWSPQAGAALYLGFAPTTPPARDPIFPQELHWRVFLPVAAQAGAAQNCTDAAQPPAPPVTLVWEYKPRATPQHWRQLNVYNDESAAFTREGYILLAGPTDGTPTREGNIPDPLYWLRCRLAAGSYPAGQAPQIDFIRPNMVPARNLTTVSEEVVGTSDGTPSQAFTLAHAPVQPDTLVLWIEVQNEDPEPWVPVEDFLASTAQDPHYVLNANSGQISFGDGQRGRVPVAGADIVAHAYRYGGGAAGNVAAGLIKSPLTSLTGIDKVTNERPAVGGSDEQDVQDLMDRAPHVLRNRNRAVTAEDFQALAEQAGGVARATALALAHPDHPGVEVPGAVTVVIVPDTTDVPPTPSSDLIRSVCRYLNGYRLLTTEVYVKGPSYQAISVVARVAANPYAAFDAVSQAVTQALNSFLSPLSPASSQSSAPGAGGQGWAFGQDLYPTALYKAILEVANVVNVLSLSVTVDGQPHDITQVVPVPSDGLVYGTNHLITVVPMTNV
jgi:predicted phage baseplate assembly protein